MAGPDGVERILVDGEWVASCSGVAREIRNPARGDLLGIVPDCDARDVDRAVAAARRARGPWARTPGVERAVHLHRVAQEIREAGRELAQRMTLESGKPLIESVDCIEWVAACFDYYAEVGRAGRGSTFPPVAPHQLNFTVKEPYGVVAAIAPFNFPLLLMAWKVAPALAAGNALVCKPPHQNPLSNLLMARAYRHLPPGVVNVVTGDGPRTGEALIRHPGVDLVAFTGSTEVGRHVAEVAGRQLKKVNLELGGIDPFVVFADADLEVAARGVAWARLLNAGQVCTSSKRIYLVKEIAEEFTRRLVEHVGTLRVGDPMAPDTDIGPLISREALERVEAQVEAAVGEGARVLLGGKALPGPGHFYAPTVLADVKHGSLSTTEEVFGPVIALTVVEDADEAIRLADDSRYGLGACIYTRSLELAMKAMEGIRAGSFWINDPLTDNDAAPFGGARWSGIGRELGEEGLDAFREPKHVHLDWVMERKSFWYPYREREVK
ncbi:MAG TPA: aldehyde dehydrogenase family protein [Anaeromyxobacter sp.]|nr:aldehyde dehydrogenase family protein [Anaeromyxobacter sp.]